MPFPSLPNFQVKRSHFFVLVGAIMLLVAFVACRSDLSSAATAGGKEPIPRALLGLGLFALAAGLIVVFWKITARQAASTGATGKELGELENEYRRTLFQVFGGALVVSGLILTWLELRANQQRQSTEQYHWAITQLGAETPIARLGGVYTLARIARESNADQKEVVEVLTFFIRNRQPLPTDSAQLRSAECNTEKRDFPFDVQAAIDVLRNRRSLQEGEEYLDLSRTDLRNANMNRMDLRRADLSGSLLAGTRLVGADLTHTKLPDVRLDAADLSGAILNTADLSHAALCGANLSNANLTNADFTGSDLAGARLAGAVFVSTTLDSTRLDRTVGLTRQQIPADFIDSTTLLPPGYQSSPQLIPSGGRCGCIARPTRSMSDDVGPESSRTHDKRN